MPPRGNKFVVLVDDDPSMNQAVTRLLGAAGLSSLAFASAEELLESDAPKSAGCFILDIYLPGISGFELAGRLAEAGYTAPVIFITGHDSPKARERAQSASAAAYFPKPFPGRGLLAATRNALREGTTPKTNSESPENVPGADPSSSSPPKTSA